MTILFVFAVVSVPNVFSTQCVGFTLNSTVSGHESAVYDGYARRNADALCT